MRYQASNDEPFYDDDGKPAEWKNYQHSILVHRRPDTEMQALMEARPFDDPPTSKAELTDIGDLLAEAVDSLDERDRYLFNALVVERVSLRQLGKRLALSKTHIARERERITSVLREKLQGHPLIEEYLGGSDE